MVSARVWCLRGSCSVVCGFAVVVATGLLGCTRMVDGSAQHAATGIRPDRPIALADLLIDPSEFPPGYPAAVLDPPSAGQAIRDLDGGVVAGSVVSPPQCAPPPLGASARDAVAVQGVDGATSSSLTTTVTRAGTPLRVRRDQLAGCPTFTSTDGDLTTTVTVMPRPAPPIDADDSYAVEQTVQLPAGPTVRALILVAQIGDVRVAAAWATDGDAAPDAGALDALFTDAVLKVRRIGGS
jgi:hypothetical protein